MENLTEGSLLLVGPNSYYYSHYLDIIISEIESSSLSLSGLSPVSLGILISCILLMLLLALQVRNIICTIFF